MAKLTALLLVVVLRAAATVSTAYATGATIPGLKARRSRFLLLTNGAAYSTPLPAYDCSKKTAAVCLAPGSPGAACCDGRCVDTGGSADHCGGCNKICNHDRVCCGGHCVDLMADKDNCGKCFNQCNKKCSYGFCDYAQ